LSDRAGIREIRCRGFGFPADVAGRPGAPLVLLLHGFPQTRYSWRAQLPALAAAGYRAVAPDQRGVAPTARPEGVEAYAIEELAADALAMADALDAERFHLVGHDWGGQLAWWIAAHRPERVRTLCVLSRPHPAAFARAMREDPGQPGRSRHHRTFQERDAADRLLADGARRLRRALEAQGVPPDDASAYLASFGRRPALDAALNWYRAASRSGGLAPELPSVRVPTLYLWGDADATVGRAAAEATGAFVDAPYHFEVIPGAGHFLTDQAAEHVTRALLAQLAQLPVPC
jgi:pimeloyl-ACP methyl ester carboxylesterase